MIIFHVGQYQALAKTLAERLKGSCGEVQIKHFADGERYMRIVTKVRDQDVVLVGGTVNDGATLEIFDLACGLVGEGARSLKILIPFFAYSTMERATKSGEVVTAKTRARLLSAIPSAPFGNQVVMLDLHSEGIPFYFEGTVKTFHLYAKPLILTEAKRLGLKDFIMGAVDAGRAKWVESLANDLGVPAAFVYKKRAQDGSVSISGTNMNVKGRPVIIYDDMIRSGGSTLQACQAYKDAGASAIHVIVTHGDFTPDAVPKMKASGLIASLACTDSHPRAAGLNDAFVRILPIAELYAGLLSGGVSHAN